MRKLVIGSRGSTLALWQSNHIADLLRRHHDGISVDIEIIETKGDKILDVALSRIGDRALFTKELENALLARTIDLAVHSLKDVPTMLPEGLMLGAIGERHDARDALVAAPDTTLQSLRNGATVATSSLRRRSQLLHLRPDFNVVDVRGNVATRLRRRIENGWDAMVLAFAGLDRLGLTSEISQVIPTTDMLPAVGQGALAIEIRADDAELAAMLTPIDDPDTRHCIIAERAMLRALEGGCQVPIGAYAMIDSTTLTLDGLVASLDGSQLIRRRIAGSPNEAATIGARLADELLAAGAGELLATARVG